MAAKNCSECDGKVSSKATKCPHCGHPMTIGSAGFDAVKGTIGGIYTIFAFLIVLFVL